MIADNKSQTIEALPPYLSDVAPLLHIAAKSLQVHKIQKTEIFVKNRLMKRFVHICVFSSCCMSINLSFFPIASEVALVLQQLKIQPFLPQTLE